MRNTCDCIVCIEHVLDWTVRTLVTLTIVSIFVPCPHSALASFLLQVCLLVCLLGGLTILRRDSMALVLGPLRAMLIIVARCECVVCLVYLCW